MIFDHLPCSLIFSEFLVIFMLFQDFLDPFFRVQQMADGGIVIQRVDQKSDVLAQIAVDIIGALQQFRCLIYQIGGQDPVKNPLFIGLIKFIQSVGKETEGGTEEYLVGIHILQKLGTFDHAVAGGNHVVDDDHVFAGDVGSQEFMSYNGIAAIDDGRVVAAFVEHSHINAQIVGDVDCAAHAAFIGADYHEMIAVYRKIRFIAQQAFDKLICRLYRFKAVQGDCILDPGIVSIESNDVFHTHVNQFLQSQGTVQRFPAGAAVLAALVEEGHDHVNAARFSAYCCDDPLQILEVIVRGHMVGMPAERVGQTVIADINQNIDVIAPDGFQDRSLGFAGAEAGSFAADQIGIPLVSVKKQGAFMLQFPFLSPLDQEIIHFLPQGGAAVHSDNAQAAVGDRVQIFHIILTHLSGSS